MTEAGTAALAKPGAQDAGAPTLSLRSDLTKIHGTHALKMGYQVFRYRLNSFTLNYPSGDFRFDLMTADVVMVGADATVAEAARLMERNAVRRLPVVGLTAP